MSLSSELSELNGGVYEPTDGFVAPGQTLYYAATVKNELDNRQAEGLLWTESSSILDMSQLLPAILQPPAAGAGDHGRGAGGAAMRRPAPTA